MTIWKAITEYIEEEEDDDRDETERQEYEKLMDEKVKEAKRWWTMKSSGKIKEEILSEKDKTKMEKQMKCNFKKGD